MIDPRLKAMGIGSKRTSTETEQAMRIFAWLDRWLPTHLKGIDDEQTRQEMLRAYRTARHGFGPTARASIFSGGPRLPVTGTGDEAHGHTRLCRVVTDVIVPLIERGLLEEGQAHGLQERLRGSFAKQWQIINKAIDRTQQQISLQDESALPGWIAEGARAVFTDVHHAMNPVLKEHKDEPCTIRTIGEGANHKKVLVEFDRHDAAYGQWWILARRLRPLDTTEEQSD